MSIDNRDLPRWANAVSRVLTYVAATGIFLLMALVFVSVISRYVFNTPIAATEDIMAILLGITIFTAFPTVTLSRGHISVDLLTAPVKRIPKLNRIRLIVIDLGIIAMTLFIAKRLFDQAQRYYKRDTGTLLMDWPLYPVAFGFCGLVLIGTILFTLRAWKDQGKVDQDDEEFSL